MVLRFFLWFFMVFHGFSCFFMVPGWFSWFFSKMYPPKLYPGPTIQSRSAARRAAQDLVLKKVGYLKVCFEVKCFFGDRLRHLPRPFVLAVLALAMFKVRHWGAEGVSNNHNSMFNINNHNNMFNINNPPTSSTNPVPLQGETSTFAFTQTQL